MRKMMKRFKNEKGLTLVELLAVIVILAIVGAIAFVLIGNIIENSKKDAHIANAQQLIESTKLYEAGGEQIPATGIDAFDLMQAGTLDKIIDPWDKAAYKNIGTESSKGTNALVKKSSE